jgi:hypothetical protein
MPRPLLTPGEDPAPILQEAVGGPQGQCRRVRKILLPTGIFFIFYFIFM